MALAYLLSPTFEIVNSAGKPATGGYIEVYIAGSRTKYYCASDFDGTLHPFRIPLDSLGSNIVLAEDTGAYDVYVYNRYGTLLMSRYNVKPGGGGTLAGTITSSDGSISVTPTSTGVDLRVDLEAPSILRATAQSLTGDGLFQFSELQRDGRGATVDVNGRVMLSEGWWHYDATVRLRWPGNPAESGTQSISLYTANGSDSMPFDLSYAHSDTVQINGEFKSATSGTQFILGVLGIPAGLTVELVDFGIHSILGEGAANGRYYAGNGIQINEADRIVSVDTDVVQEKLVAGQNIVIEGNVISALGTYTQEQADWAQTDSEAASYIKNKPDLSVYATTSAVDTALAGKQDVISDLSTIRSGAAAGATAVQPGSLATVATSGSYNDLSNKPSIPAALSAGDGISIASDVVSAKVDGTTISVNLDGELVALGTGTDSAFLARYGTTTYQEIAAAVADNRAVFVTGSANALTAVMPMTSFNTNPAMVLFGTLIGSTEQTVKLDQGVWSCDYADIQADWSETNQLKPSYIANKPANLVQDASYVHTDNNFTNADATKLSGIAAGAEVNVQSDWNVTDTSSDSYIANKPTIPAAPVQSNWNESDSSSLAYIQNKPSIPSATSDLTNDSGFITLSDVPAQVQADWTESDTGDPSYIQNKPSIPSATSDLTNDSGFITLSDVPAQVNADWNSSSGASEILNKPTIPSGTQLVPAATSADADKVLTVDAQGTPAWANAQAPISAGNGIDITNNVVSAKVDGTTITTNGSGELAVVNGGQSTASSFFTPAYGKSADGSLSTARLGPSLHTRYTAFNTYGLALEGYTINSSISVLGRRPDVRLANFIQPNGKIIFMYGASTWNASWYAVWFPCNHRNDSAGYINVIDPTVYLKAKSPVTFTWQGTEGQSIYNSDGTYNTNFNSSNRYSFSVTAPLSTGYNVDADTYDMIGDWTSITTPPLDEWVLAFWDGNNNTWKNIGGSTEANSHIAVKWNISSLDVKVMSGGGLDINIGAGIYVTNPLPTSSSSDEGKVLTVNSSGSAEWGNASSVTVDQTYDGTSTNAQSGTAVAEAVATKEDAFDVGTGLEMDTSGSTPTLQVEAPVDIVAGPGIVVDNPDGNTLRVSLGISGSWTDVATEASYNTTNINAGSFKIMYNPALNLVALTCDVNVGAGESTFFTWSNRLKPVFNDMALGSNLYVSQSGLKQAAGSTSRWINGAFMWPVVGGN